jgi:hypothetical protein
MKYIAYTILPQHLGSKAEYHQTAKHFPWCFPSFFIPPERTPGIAPVLGVRFTYEHPVPFIAAVTPQSIENFSSTIIELDKLHNLETALQTVNDWLRDHLPLWLQQLTQPNYHLYLLNGSDTNPLHSVDGGSAALSAILARVSELLQHPLPIDWVYSATVSDKGRLGPVNALASKIQGALNMCPHVRHIVVGCITDHEFAQLQETFQSRITIHRCRSIQEALECIPITAQHTIQQMIQRQLTDYVEGNPERLAIFSEDIFVAIQQGWSQIYGWGSLYRTLVAMYEMAKSHTHTTPKTLYLLELSILIACRYQSSPNTPLEEQPSCLLHLRQDHIENGVHFLTIGEWYTLLPHLLQQLTDRPDLVDCKALLLRTIQSNLPSQDQQWYTPLQLRLMGAWGRYLFETGTDEQQLREAFHWQQLCFEHWFIQGLFYEASYPLCAMMQLCESLPDIETSVWEYWLSFKRKPNSKYQTILQFMPSLWQKRIQMSS